MGLTEWFLLIVVVVLVPLVIAIVVTLWSLEQARQRTRRNRRDENVRRITLPRPEVSERGQEAEERSDSEGRSSTSPHPPAR